MRPQQFSVRDRAARFAPPSMLFTTRPNVLPAPSSAPFPPASPMASGSRFARIGRTINPRQSSPLLRPPNHSSYPISPPPPEVEINSEEIYHNPESEDDETVNSSSSSTSDNGSEDNEYFRESIRGSQARQGITFIQQAESRSNILNLSQSQSLRIDQKPPPPVMAPKPPKPPKPPRPLLKSDSESQPMPKTDAENEPSTRPLLQPEVENELFSRPQPKPEPVKEPPSRPLPKPVSEKKPFSRPLPKPDSEMEPFSRPLPKPEPTNEPSFRPLPKPESGNKPVPRPLPKSEQGKELSSRPLPKPEAVVNEISNKPESREMLPKDIKETPPPRSENLFPNQHNKALLKSKMKEAFPECKKLSTETGQQNTKNRGLPQIPNDKAIGQKKDMNTLSCLKGGRSDQQTVATKNTKESNDDLVEMDVYETVENEQPHFNEKKNGSVLNTVSSGNTMDDEENSPHEQTPPLPPTRQNINPPFIRSGESDDTSGEISSGGSEISRGWGNFMNRTIDFPGVSHSAAGPSCLRKASVVSDDRDCTTSKDKIIPPLAARKTSNIMKMLKNSLSPGNNFKIFEGSRQEAEKLLLKRGNGYFLIRSGRLSDYVVSARVDDRFFHVQVKLKKNPFGYYIDEKGEMFPTLIELAAAIEKTGISLNGEASKVLKRLPF